MKLLILLLFSLIQGFVLAQKDFPIIWGELERSQGSLLEILPKNSTDFYSLRYTGSSFGTYRISENENLTFLQQKRIKLVAETGIANFETAYYFGNQLIVFLSDKSNGLMTLYMQPYDNNIEVAGPSILIASYANNKIGAQPNFNIIQSQNRKYVGIIWEIPGRKEISDIYGYKVIDQNLKEVQSGEYDLPFDGNLTTINEQHVSNTGDYLVSITEHIKPNDRLFGRDFENFKALHLYKINNNQLKEFSIEVDGLRVDDMQLNSNDSGICTLSGLFGKGNRQGILGVFIVTIDAKIDSVISKGIIQFDKEIARENWIDNDLYDRQTTNVNSTNLQNQYYNYRLRDIFVLEDGSLVGSMEQYYAYRRTNFDNRTGISSNVMYYYYDDIIAFKIGKTGTFDWQKRISKSQVSINDGGPFSSYSSFTDGKTINFIFNDNLRNYDDLGNFRQDLRRVYVFNLSKRKNVAAITRLNLNDGQLERKNLFARKELKSIVVPKIFKVDLVNKEILMYSILGNRERFGVLNFKSN
jgi:hypothetical protein